MKLGTKLFAAAVVASVPLLGGFSVARAGSLGIANDYNLFVLNNMTQSFTDAEGRVAVGNNATLNGYSVASSFGNSGINFVVGGTASQTGGTVNGTAVSTGNYTITNGSVSGNLYSAASINQTGGTSHQVVAGTNYTVANAAPDSAIIAGNYTQTGGNMAGTATVGGKLTLAGGGGGTGHFQVNGNVDASGAGSVGGGITYAGTYTGPGYISHTAGPAVPINTSTYTALPFSFADAATYLTGASSYWGSLAANGTVATSSGHLNLTGTSATLNIFNLTSSQITSGITFGITVPTGSTALININGTTVSLGSFGFSLSGVDAEHILFNAYNATTLSMGGVGLLGSLLAPGADVNFASGNIDGTLIANNLTGQGESHNHQFTGDIPTAPSPGPHGGPAVPLPSSALGSTLLLGLLAARRRRA